MTCSALLERNGLFEVAGDVALGAGKSFVLSDERETGLAVVELAAQLGCADTPPGNGIVTTLAGGFEASSVRVRVARVASAELNAGPFRLLAGASGDVALLAEHFFVASRQHEAGLRMVEVGNFRPVGRVVAIGAVLSELAFVLIHVTRDALVGDSQEGLVQIHHADIESFGSGNALHVVALCAGEICVLALKRPSGLRVVELLLAGLPLDQLKGGSVVLRMATPAGLAPIVLLYDARMITATFGNARGNVGMAIEAPECGVGAGLVTLGAVGGPFQGGVST